VEKKQKKQKRICSEVSIAVRGIRRVSAEEEKKATVRRLADKEGFKRRIRVRGS